MGRNPVSTGAEMSARTLPARVTVLRGAQGG